MGGRNGPPFCQLAFDRVLTTTQFYNQPILDSTVPTTYHAHYRTTDTPTQQPINKGLVETKPQTTSGVNTSTKRPCELPFTAFGPSSTMKLILTTLALAGLVRAADVSTPSTRKDVGPGDPEGSGVDTLGFPQDHLRFGVKRMASRALG